MPESTVEDMIYHRADEERARGDLSFAPLYQFLSEIAHRARAHERQTILDTLPQARPADKSQEWNDGYTAAVTAIIHTCLMRSFTG
jgi:hypothetical protein